MKAMRSMNNRMLGSLKRKPRDANSDDSTDAGADTPEANAARNVRLFAESGGPNGGGDEVLYLPAIVDAAESSPDAAKECATVIRKYISKDNLSKPYVQYNAIMLIRILADNPGKTFTRNLDAKFVQTVKELLRVGRDPGVRQILVETLNTFEREKATDETLAPMVEMWKREQVKMMKLAGPPAGPRVLTAPPLDPHSQNYFSRNHHIRKLPPPNELAARIEEARNSAQLLSQVVQSTPPSELLDNDLVREFADRCQSASRSVQAYMIAENPAPDNDTMETLIETNDRLSKALSQHQRGILNARKILGLGNGESTPRNSGGFAPPSGPPPQHTNSGFAAPPPLPSSSRPAVGRKSVPQVPPPGDFAPVDDSEEEKDPFRDPTAANPPFPSDKPSSAAGQFNDTLGVEPYHPGFKETTSYMGRQDSSVGHLTMSAAVPEEESPVISPETPHPSKPLYRY